MARPWNLRPSYFKSETGKTPDAYYVSGKLLEVTQLVTEGPQDWGPHGLLLTLGSVGVFSFPSGLPQTPCFQFHVIRPPITFCLQTKAGSSCSVRSPVFHKVTRPIEAYLSSQKDPLVGSCIISKTKFRTCEVKAIPYSKIHDSNQGNRADNKGSRDAIAAANEDKIQPSRGGGDSGTVTVSDTD